MDKYREITPEEKLEYNKEMLEALIKNGFMGADIVHEKWKLKLSNRENTVENVFDKETLKLHEQAMSEGTETVHTQSHSNQPRAVQILLNTPKQASIYAKEHLPAVMEDLSEQHQVIEERLSPVVDQPKTKVLEQERPAPSIWGNAKTVEPGQFQNLL